MRTAISLPDELFEAVERLAKRTNRERSELYVEALLEYVARHGDDEVTRALDAVLEDLQAKKPDEFARAAAQRTLAATDW